MTEMQLRDYAKVGAQLRLQALEQERAAILANFPELRNGHQPKAGRALSAAQRKAIGRRMKAYWAKRRAEKR